MDRRPQTETYEQSIRILEEALRVMQPDVPSKVRVVTANANGLEPYAYLRRIFERLPCARTVAEYESLLPFATFANS